MVLNPGGEVDYSFTRIDSIPENCNKATYNKTPKENFEVLWETFNEHYAFFKQRNIDWNDIHKKYSPVIDTVSSDKVLYNVFKEILDRFDDGHIKLIVPDSLKETSKPQTIAETQPITKEKIKADIINEYVSDAKTYNHVVTWGKLKHINYGYIHISDMNNFAHYIDSKIAGKQEFRNRYDEISQTKMPKEFFNDEIEGVDYIMNKILSDYKDTDAIVVDLRFNGGGYGRVALQLLQYFIKESRHVMTIKAKNKDGFTGIQKIVLTPPKSGYNGELIVLTSHHTASAAEVFVLGTLAYPEIKRYGSSTRGIFSEILWKNLPNGWEFSLSNEIYTNAQGHCYEIKGIPPNYNTSYSKLKSDFYKSFYRKNGFQDHLLDMLLLQ